MIRILFVCMGNLCRSPLAATVVRDRFCHAGLGRAVHTDSAGTHASNSRESADRRAQQVASGHAYSLAAHRSRRVRVDDFEKFDLILAMDSDNLAALLAQAPIQYRNKIALFLSYAEGVESLEVPDPYYGNLAGFERVLALCELGATGLLSAYENDRLPQLIR